MKRQCSVVGCHNELENIEEHLCFDCNKDWLGFSELNDISMATEETDKAHAFNHFLNSNKK